MSRQLERVTLRFCVTCGARIFTRFIGLCTEGCPEDGTITGRTVRAVDYVADVTTRREEQLSAFRRVAVEEDLV